MAFELPKLPYAFDALEPVMMSDVIKFFIARQIQAHLNLFNEVGSTLTSLCYEDDMVAKPLLRSRSRRYVTSACERLRHNGNCANLKMSTLIRCSELVYGRSLFKFMRDNFEMVLNVIEDTAICGVPHIWKYALPEITKRYYADLEDDEDNN